MTLIKTSVRNWLNSHAGNIINRLPDTFDSHDFIRELIKEDESGYVDLLHSFIGSNAIFRQFHSQIGRYLSVEKDNLRIRSTGEAQSENIKDYISSNEGWVKI